MDLSRICMLKSSKRAPYATNVHADLGLQSLSFEFQIKTGLIDF
jgi:hypothetical protein